MVVGVRDSVVVLLLAIKLTVVVQGYRLRLFAPSPFCIFFLFLLLLNVFNRSVS